MADSLQSRRKEGEEGGRGEKVRRGGGRGGKKEGGKRERR